MTPAISRERWQEIKHLVNAALNEDSQARTRLLQQSCADDFALRIGAEALLSVTRKLPEQPLGPEQWQRIEQLFQAALELTPSKQPAFLAQACNGDEILKHEVESLLIYQGAAGALIGGAVHEAAGLLPTDEKARFTPGTTLNKRYRILGLLGKGGMGEVYRADDLKLGQPVALKFLTEKLSQDKAMLARFHSEVSMAHRVTHPNVCRVHDIGEVNTSSGTLQFLSMEYVDGEDLSLLLRRIGRLPSDKAVEIAQQLCAGLAAAHEAGVLHRDLKPANVMIDGKGRVRITDFGLAGFAEQITGSEVMAGTPAYMSPEQFAGKEVTTKSDIYALGLVLYEVFTGKRVFEAGSLEELKRMHESSAPTTPSSWVKDLDPLVERVILRCLEKDPARRLASAKQVADALPGGDPLAAALALGETPSPEMVAAAGSKTGMKPMYAVLCLLAILVGIGVMAALNRKVHWFEHASFDKPPEVLAQKAREIAAQLGYPDQPVDSAYELVYDFSQLYHYGKNAADRLRKLERERPSPVHFYYRESPNHLQPIRTHSNKLGVVNNYDPPRELPGMLNLGLDARGYLQFFGVEPPLRDNLAQTAPKPDWNVLNAAIGFNLSTFTPVEPEVVPDVAYDARVAWTGTYPNQEDSPVRVEAAAYRGKIVSVWVEHPWNRQGEQRSFMASSAGAGIVFVTAIIVAVLLTAILLAQRNIRQNRGDKQGAFRLAVFVAGVLLLSWLVSASHVPTSGEIDMLTLAIRDALYIAGMTWVVYLALEPYVRRRWPGKLTSWNRVLNGQLRDSLVGRDLLLGLALGITLKVVNQLNDLAFIPRGRTPSNLDFYSLVSLRQAMGTLFDGTAISVSLYLGIFFLIFLLCVWLRREWVAGVIFILIPVTLNFFFGNYVTALYMSIFFCVLFLVTTRLGLLALVAAGFVTDGISKAFPLTTDFSAWYFSHAVIGGVLLMALALYAFHTSLGGQKVFSGNLLEE